MNWKKFLLFNAVIILFILIIPYIAELIINGYRGANFFITMGGGEFIVLTILGIIFFNLYFILDNYWKNLNKKASFILLFILMFLFVPFIHPNEICTIPEFVGATCDSSYCGIDYNSMRGTDFFGLPSHLNFDSSRFFPSTSLCADAPKIIGFSYFFISIPLSLF